MQRFRDGFTRLPAVRHLGQVYDVDRQRALALADTSGWLMAAELRAVGVDLSFAPVLDLDRGLSTVIGDRAFSPSPEVVTPVMTLLLGAYVGGLSFFLLARRRPPNGQRPWPSTRDGNLP